MKKLSLSACLSATMLSGILFAAIMPASAQTSNNPNNVNPGSTPSTGAQPATPSLPPPVTTATPSAPAPFGLSTITDWGTQLGQNLQQKGIYLQLGYTEDFSGNVSGGFKRGEYPTGELFFGTVLDLQTMFGLTGSSLHITLDERNGYPVDDVVGTQGPLQANSGPTRAIRLSELYWEQGFDNDRYDFVVGRTNPTLDFATSDIACQFVSSIICAQPGSWYYSNNNEAYPASTWGGRVNVVPVPKAYVRVGIYDDDTNQLNPNENGFTWNTTGSTGVLIPAEVGYATTFGDTQYPVKYDVGGYWDDANYTPAGGVPSRGRTAFYVQGLQTVWRPDPHTNQSVQLFGGAIVYGKDAPYWGQYYAGVFDRGPFVSRPNDTIGLIASYYAMNSIEVPNKPSQWIFEANYGFSVVSGVTIKPFAQYVISPNNPLAPVGTKEPANAVVLGVQVAINIGNLLHMPQFIPH